MLSTTAGHEWNHEDMEHMNIKLFARNSFSYIIDKLSFDYQLLYPTARILYEYNIDIPETSKENFNKIIEDCPDEISDFIMDLVPLCQKGKEGNVNETYVKDMVKSFLRIMGCDKKNTQFQTEPEHVFKYTVGDLVVTAIPDRLVIDKEKNIILCFQEAKRKWVGEQMDRIPQISSECLGMIFEQYNANPCRENYYALAILVRSRFLSFFYCKAPNQALKQIKKGKKPREYVELNYFTHGINDYGFDLANTTERRIIIEIIYHFIYNAYNLLHFT